MAKQEGKRLLTIPQYQAQFEKVLKTMVGRYRVSEVWNDFIELAAIAVHQSAYMNSMIEKDSRISDEHKAMLRAATMPRDQRWAELEEQYMSYVPKYGSEGMKDMAQLYSIVTDAIEGHRTDFLGPLYMRLELAGKSDRQARGEFFTPESVAKMMAQMIVPQTIDELIEAQGYLRVQEPTCGAGGMLIWVAEAMETQGYDPRVYMYAEGIDINRGAFNMCYLQLALLDIPARVWCGDSLLMKYCDCRETPQLMLSRYHWLKNPAFRMLQALGELELIGRSEEEPTSVPVQRQPLPGNSSIEGKGPCQPSILDGLEDGENAQSLSAPIKAPPQAQVFKTDDGGQFRLF